MIIIGIPKLRADDKYAILENEISINGKTDVIWFKVDKLYSDYICYERDDAYLVACLNYAMRNGHDIECLAPITEELLFKINTYLIPALKENNPSFHKVKIKANISSEALPCAGKVGTGISCGVDSFHSLAEHTDSIYKSHNITHLTFNNVGSHGEGEHARQLFRSRVARPQKFAEEYGFEFVLSDSNLMDVIKQSHFKTHTYSSMFPVLCMRKLYSAYFYSSGGYKFNEFNLYDAPQICCGSYEMLSLDVFSTSSLKIYSEGLGKTRMDKLREVVKYRPSFSYLNVCLDEGDNCNKCEKCVRTLLGLDALNALDNYSGVFDIQYYRNNKKWYLQELMYHYKEGKHDYIELYEYLKHEITPVMHAKANAHILKNKVRDLIASNNTLYKVAKKFYIRWRGVAKKR